MTITATWADLEPGTVVDREVHEAIVSTPGDVRKLVDALARPNTSEARLVHTARPQEYDEISGQLEYDNQVIVGTWGQFGYIEFFDPGHWSQPVGDPASPEWHTTTSGHFHAGTGIPVETLVEAVTEFLRTARRPTCVRWREIGGSDD